MKTLFAGLGLALISSLSITACATDDSSSDECMPGDIDCADPASGGGKADGFDYKNDPARMSQHLEYKLASLPKKGKLEKPIWKDRYPQAVAGIKVAWADTYWPTSEGSHNARWQSPTTKSPLEKYDAAFNNAGATSYGAIETQDAAEFDRVFATNVRGVWMLVQQEIIAMRAQGLGGAIVNTSSIAATGGNAGLSIYGASKGALDAMIRPLAIEVGGDGIRINNVSPGLTRTAMSEGIPEEGLAAIGAHSALKRIAEPADIGDVAVWLCTDEARFVTGQSIVVDGGYNIAGMR